MTIPNIFSQMAGSSSPTSVFTGAVGGDPLSDPTNVFTAAVANQSEIFDPTAPMDFTFWSQLVESYGGHAVTWPFDDANYGAPAAKWDSPGLYAHAFNDGIATAAQNTRTNDNQTFYTLYQNVVNAPHIMTTFEKLEAEAFNAGDTAAQKLGLPSLATLSAGLKLALFTGAAVVAVLLLGKVNEGTSR